MTEEVKLIACIEDGRVETGRPLHSFGKIGMDYTTTISSQNGTENNVAAQLDIDVVNGPSLQGTALFAAPRFRVGGEFLFNTHVRALSLGDVDLTHFPFTLSLKTKERVLNL